MSTRKLTWRKLSSFILRPSCSSWAGTLLSLVASGGSELTMSGIGSTCYSFIANYDVLIIFDLKLGRFNPADAGQMHLYLNYAKEHWMHEGENPPVGVILCAQKGEAVAHYALEGLANKVLAREYMTVLPSEKLLVQEIEKVRNELTKREKRPKR